MKTAPVWQQIKLADTPPTLWKNGGGTTRELLAWPASQDFNLMARSAHHPRTDMQRVKGQAHGQGTTSTLLAVWAHTAPATLHLEDHAAIHLKPGTLAWAALDAAQVLAVHGDDALLMEISL